MSDTLQLNYQNSELQKAMLNELLEVAKKCDGVRCDMAMLVLPEIFQKTWGDLANNANNCETNFWKEAIEKVKSEFPNFVFMAEVYWDKEWELQQLGFDYTYDKKLYDLLKQGQAWVLDGHLHADADFQMKSIRFLENHDEERAPAVFKNWEHHQAAAVIAFLIPGLRFFHAGQMEGRTKHISMHLKRRVSEKKNQEIELFYTTLLDHVLIQDTVRNGTWELLPTWPAWEGNISKGNFITFMWLPRRSSIAKEQPIKTPKSPMSRSRSQSFGEEIQSNPIAVVVNFSEYKSQW